MPAFLTPCSLERKGFYARILPLEGRSRVWGVIELICLTGQMEERYMMKDGLVRPVIGRIVIYRCRIHQRGEGQQAEDIKTGLRLNCSTRD